MKYMCFCCSDLLQGVEVKVCRNIVQVSISQNRVAVPLEAWVMVGSR